MTQAVSFISVFSLTQCIDSSLGEKNSVSLRIGAQCPGRLICQRFDMQSIANAAYQSLRVF